MKTIAVLAALALGTSAMASTYKLDTSHSEVGFQVSHLMVAKVKGRFNEYDATFSFDEKSKVLENLVANIQVESIDTREPDRDKHLRSKDFFDADKNETIIFKQTKKAVLKEKKSVTVEGDLTIKGVAKPVKLKVTYNGAINDPWGNRKLGFEASTKVNRQDYGITWNKSLDGGGVVVGDQVEVMLAGEAVSTEAKK